MYLKSKLLQSANTDFIALGTVVLRRLILQPRPQSLHYVDA